MLAGIGLAASAAAARRSHRGQDSAERRQTQEALQRLNRLYETLYAANQAIIRAKDQQSFLQEICAIIVEHGGFVLAWIGMEHASSRKVQAIASCGSASGYLDDLQISAAPGPTGSGPTGTAIRDKVSVLCNDFMQAPMTAAWHARAKRYGIKSSAAFPLLISGKHIGALTIYSDPLNCFTADYSDLLERLSANISFALEAMDREQLHRQVQEQLAAMLEREASMATELSLQDEQIRLRVASELHDQIGQSLILGQIKLGTVDAATLSEENKASVAEVRGLLKQVIHDVRALTQQLAPPALSNAGLETALHWLCRQIADDYRLPVLFHDDREAKALPEVINSIIYQSARELLINAAKHAFASTAKLSVGRRAEQFVLEVEDDGIGFDQAEPAGFGKDGGFGLFNITRQIRHLGGTVTVTRPASGGSLIAVQVPLSANIHALGGGDDEERP